jgi:hypothetical protein
MADMTPTEVQTVKEVQRKKSSRLGEAFRNMDKKVYWLILVLIAGLLFLLSYGKITGDTVWKVIAVILIMFLFSAVQEIKPTYLRIEEAEAILIDHLMKRQKKGTIEEGKITMGNFKVHRTDMLSEGDENLGPVPDAYEIGFKITDRDAIEYLYSAEVRVHGPMQGYVLASKERPEGFTGRGATNVRTDMVVIQDSKWKQWWEGRFYGK